MTWTTRQTVVYLMELKAEASSLRRMADDFKANFPHIAVQYEITACQVESVMRRIQDRLRIERFTTNLELTP